MTLDEYGTIDLNFEKPDNLVEMFQESAKKFTNCNIFGEKDANKKYQWVTYEYVKKRIDNLRGGLAELGIGEGDAVGIIAGNRKEWFIGENATHGLKARWIPMYEKELVSMWKYVIKDAAIKVLFVSRQEIVEKIKPFLQDIPTLEKIILIEGTGNDSLKELEIIGMENPVAAKIPAADDVAVLIYTSGTTGEPKGVLLTHGNLMFVSRSGVKLYPELGTQTVALNMLPWAHSYALSAELHSVLLIGGSIAMMESVETLSDDLAAIKPTFLVTVPRVYNKVYQAIYAKMKQEGGIVYKLFLAAIKAAMKKLDTGKKGLKYKFFDKIVLSKLREKMGGRLEESLTASAKMDVEVSRFFHAIGLPVMECYGLTETAPAITISYPDGGFKFGSVGKPIAKTKVIIDKSKVEPDSKDGEILAFGPYVMAGYHNKPEKTAEVIVEINGVRGVCTGDRGWLDDGGFLYITGRFKEEYKLQNGKYVHPADIEESMKLLPYIANALVYGDGKQYNIALVVLTYDMLEDVANRLKLSLPVKEIVKNKQITSLVEKEIQVHLKKTFGGYEIPKKFVNIDEDFTLENGLLTQTMKLKRSEVVKKYKNIIESLY